MIEQLNSFVMGLKLLKHIELPKHLAPGGFDHADVDLETGKVFLAHTANGSIEVIDGRNLVHLTSLPICPEASGVLSAQEEGLIFAAARGTGKLAVINSKTDAIINEITVGPRPNGLAWDSKSKQLLVADIEQHNARLVEPTSGACVALAKLPGRPRWCVYDHRGDRFFVNIKDPPGVAILESKSLADVGFVRISSLGPHGLDIDEEMGHLFVACDAKAVVEVDIKTEKEIKKISISGEPDVIWYNQKVNRLYCAIGNPGIIEIIDANEMAIAKRISTEEGAHTLTFDKLRQQVYVFLPKSCRAAVFTE